MDDPLYPHEYSEFFFIVVYLHMFRGLYYGSYKAPRELLWILSGNIFLMMATAFMGYVLPWGQMSFGVRLLLQPVFRYPLCWREHCDLVVGRFLC